MVSRIIYNAGRVSNTHLCVTIAFQDRLRSSRDVDKLTNTRFGPSEVTENPAIRYSSSVLLDPSVNPEKLSTQ
jgi:hypothetical protein